jgi:hypothetical protein
MLTYIFEYITRNFTGAQSVSHITDEEMESFIDLGKDNGAIDDGEHERIK